MEIYFIGELVDTKTKLTVHISPPKGGRKRKGIRRWIFIYLRTFLCSLGNTKLGQYFINMSFKFFLWILLSSMDFYK